MSYIDGSTPLPTPRGDLFPASADTSRFWDAASVNSLRAAVAELIANFIPGVYSTSLVTATGSSTARTLAARAADTINVFDYVVGDGATDDYTGFVTACARAVSTRKPLALHEAKIYLASQSAPIPSDGLYLVGASALDHTDLALGNASTTSENWGLENGVAAQFDAVRTTVSATRAGVIFSKYNGPIFTGKALGGRDFTVIGFPGSANSSAFVQTTPTSYPGWSVAFRNLRDASFFYFGSHGLWAKGGLEITKLTNVQVGYCGGACLNLSQTVGVNSPLEYVEIDGGAYVGGLLGNVRFIGASKSISVHGANLSSAGQLGRRADATYGTGFVVSTEADIVYPLYFSPTPASQAAITSLDTITIRNNYSEWDQALVQFDAPANGTPYYKHVVIEDNFLDPLQNTVKHIAAFRWKVFGLRTARNYTKYGPIWWFDAVQSPTSASLSIGEAMDDDSPATFDGYMPTGTQMARSAASYLAWNGQTVASNSESRIYYHMVEYDPAAAVTNSGTTSWTFTATTSGVYSIKAMLAVTVANVGAAGTVYQVRLYKNGSIFRRGRTLNGVQTVGNVEYFPVVADVALTKGDTLWVTFFQNSGSTVTVLGDTTANYIAISPAGS